MYLTDFAMESKIEIIQINISGEDKPGMTSSLTDILARYDAFILDIGQANIHQSLTLGILFMTTSDKSGAILKELLFKASELGVMIRFTPITEEHYQAWVGRQGKNRYIITLLGRQVTARHIAGVTKAVAEQGLNIDAIKRMTGRVPLHEDERAPKSCIVPPAPASSFRCAVRSAIRPCCRNASWSCPTRGSIFRSRRMTSSAAADA